MKYAKVLRQALNALFYLCSLIGFMQFLSLIMLTNFEGKGTRLSYYRY